MRPRLSLKSTSNTPGSQQFYDGTNLASVKLMLGGRLGERYYIQKLNWSIH